MATPLSLARKRAADAAAGFEGLAVVEAPAASNGSNSRAAAGGDFANVGSLKNSIIDVAAAVRGYFAAVGS
ncbi:hypothetical protein ACFX2I_036459 [Malus domestica]